MNQTANFYRPMFAYQL